MYAVFGCMRDFENVQVNMNQDPVKLRCTGQTGFEIK